MYIECPHCHTQYPEERLDTYNHGLVPDRIYTIGCLTCKQQFDVTKLLQITKVKKGRMPWSKETEIEEVILEITKK